MRRAAWILPAALGLVLFCVTLAMAVTSQTWRQREKDDFAKGELKGVSLLYDGALRLSPRLDSVHEGGQPYLWAIAEAPGGAMFVSGGNDGTVLRVGKGEAKVFFRAQEPEVHALAVDKSGNLLAGASPGGKIYKISPDGKTLWTYDSGEKYVWALVFDREGALYAATGIEGRILKVDAAGHGRVFFDSAETHIRSLMLNDKGELIAGTDGHGLVFRVSAAGEGFVLYDAPLNEIVALAPGKDGTIYAAVADESGRPSSRGPSPGPPPAAPPPPGAPGSSESATPQATPPPPPEQAPPPEQRVPIGMEGKVLAIARDGYARELWAGGQEAILSLAVASDGTLLMGSSAQGKIYGLDASGNVTELLRLASAQVTALLRRSSGDVAVAGSNSGSVSLLRSGYAASGTYESRVLDARSFATWGRASWRTETPKGTSIALGVRCGNTEEPDRTWTDWRGAPFAQDSALLDCPASRFLQWRAQLKSDDQTHTPSLREVAVTYLQANLPPEIKKVEVQAPGVAFQKVPPSGGPGGPSDSRSSGSSGGDVEGGVRKRPRPQSRRGYEDGARSISWQASDPNDDDLLYDVYYRAADEKTWKKIRDRVDEDFVTLDSQAMPDGTYLFRVVATDAPSNPPGRALTAEKLSAAFDVDNTPPRIENIKAQVQPNALRLTFAASDSFSIIRETACSVDAGDWLPLQAADGLDDSRSESYDVPLPRPGPGEHSIVVRSIDAAGNTGSGKVVVEIPQ
jgi:outer membrane protein assembly factor BamB